MNTPNMASNNAEVKLDELIIRELSLHEFRNRRVGRFPPHKRLIWVDVVDSAKLSRLNVVIVVCYRRVIINYFFFLPAVLTKGVVGDMILW